MQVKGNENHSISRVGARAVFALAIVQKVVHIEMHFLAFTLCVTVVHTRIFFRFYFRYGNSHMYSSVNICISS